MMRFGILTASLVGALAFALPANAATIQFTATLSGAAEVPPVTTSGTGTATVTLDDVSHQLTWNIAYQNLTGPVTLAHFHGPATPLEGGAPASITIPLPDGGATSPLTGSATITTTQEGYLLDGLLYINLHTAAHSGGEIRGQVLRQQTDGGTEGGDGSMDGPPDAPPDGPREGGPDADAAGGTGGREGGTTGTGGAGTGGTGTAGRGGTSGGTAGRGGTGTMGTGGGTMGSGGTGTAGRGGTSGRGGTGGSSAPPADDDDGCGCRTVGDSGSAAGLIGLALGGLMLSRRMAERRARRENDRK